MKSNHAVSDLSSTLLREIETRRDYLLAGRAIAGTPRRHAMLIANATFVPQVAPRDESGGNQLGKRVARMCVSIIFFPIIRSSFFPASLDDSMIYIFSKI